MTSVNFPGPAGVGTMSRGMCGSEENLATSTDEESSEEESRLPVLHGTLNKWTNYLHGWQERYLVLRDGTLSYFKSAHELKVGCRGAIRLVNANITPHKYDVCRFEVAISDSIWYLRSSNEEERQRWVAGLEQHRAAVSTVADSGYGSENSLRRHNSLISITSGASLSTASASSAKRGFGLKEKLLEMETFKEILNKQVDTLQAYFDSCAALVHNSVHDLPMEDEEESVEEVTVQEEIGEEAPSTAPQRPGFLSRFLPFGRNPAPRVPVSDLEETIDATPSSCDPGRHFSVPSDSRKQQQLEQLLREHGALALDFKGNSYTFKATTTGILANLGHCIELMMQREEYWRRRLDREIERRRRVEDAYRALATSCTSGDGNSTLNAAQRASGAQGDVPATKLVVLGGPDLEEGPGCSLGEEEFFDAVDAQLDKMAEAEERADALARVTKTLNQVGDEEGSDPIPLDHPLHDVIEEWIERQFDLVDLDLQNLNGWTLLHQDGEMRMFKRADDAPPESGDAGSFLSPLKAVHTVSGVTAKEMCRLFWDVRYRQEWENTLDRAPEVLELPGRQTAVLHQVYRRVWPATQRDACFWSAMRRRGDMWMVVNRSTDHAAPPLDSSRMLRLWLNVAFVCKTVVPPGKDPASVERRQVRCKMQYTATLDPGGWVPKGAAKAIYEREYPKFLNRFAEYVFERCKSEPLDL